MHKRVYSVFQINLILSLITSLATAPIVAVISYIFSLDDITSVENILYIALFFTLLVFLVTFGYTFFTRERTRRRLKPSYQREYMYSLSISALSVFGMTVLFLYFGGDQNYMFHVLIPIGIVEYTFMYLIGDRFFNVRFIRR